MFGDFIKSIQKWSDAHSQSAAIHLLSAVEPVFPATPPEFPHVIKGFLETILPPQGIACFLQRPYQFHQLQSLLTGLGSYIIEKSIRDVLDESLVSLLSLSERERLTALLYSLEIMRDQWIDGRIHSLIISNPVEAISRLTRDLSLENDWKCAEFLSRCGYGYPHSSHACICWERYSGSVSSQTSWFDWLDLLASEKNEHENAFQLDRYLDVVFNPVFSDFIDTLCVDQNSCRICPLIESCKTYRSSFSPEYKIECLNDIKTGDIKEIPSSSLLTLLSGDLWFDTPSQNKFIAKYPDISASDFQDIDSANDEAFLSFLLATKELTARNFDTEGPLSGKSFTCAGDIYKSFGQFIREEQQESFYTLILDNKHRIIKNRLITRGTLNQSLVHPREVFAAAIQLRSAALVLIHNHPSGDPSPSEQDMAITSRLQEVGELVGIKVLDHIIVGRQGYFSFVDEDLM